MKLFMGLVRKDLEPQETLPNARCSIKFPNDKDIGLWPEFLKEQFVVATKAAENKSSRGVF